MDKSEYFLVQKRSQGKDVQLIQTKDLQAVFKNMSVQLPGRFPSECHILNIFHSFISAFSMEMREGKC